MAFAATAPVLAHARCDGCPFARQAGPMTPATEKAGTRKLSLHVEQFDLEDQSGVGRNDAARTARAIDGVDVVSAAAPAIAATKTIAARVRAPGRTCIEIPFFDVSRESACLRLDGFRNARTARELDAGCEILGDFPAT